MTQEKIKELAGIFGKVHEVSNNGREGFGVNTGNIVSPVFYFDVFEGMTETEAYNFIKGMLEKASPTLDVESVKDWEKAKDKVYPCIAMHIQGDDLFVEKFLNMDLYFRYEFTDELTTKVTNSLMDMWDISAEMLKEKALQNMKERGYEMKDMISFIIGGILGNELEDDRTLVSDMYILSCKSDSFGAPCIMDNALLDKVASRLRKNKIIILPSSVHEVLVLNSEVSMSPAELSAMVSEINGDKVKPSERLSDSAYIYDAIAGKLMEYK